MSSRSRLKKQFEHYISQTAGLLAWMGQNKAETAIVAGSTSKWFLKNITYPSFVIQSTGIGMQASALALEHLGITTQAQTDAFFDVTHQGEMHGFGWIVKAPVTYWEAGKALGEATQEYNIFNNAKTVWNHYF